MSANMMTLQSVARALGGEISGDQVICPGPGHSSRDRSLSVKLSNDAPDGFIVCSFSGDDPIVCRDYVRQRCGMAPFRQNGGRRHRATYEFRDPTTGDVRYHKERLEHPDGSKSFLFKPAGRNGSAPLLYGGERLGDIADGGHVFIVEGEKKVDRLRELGAVAVSTDSGSSSKWLPSHASLLRGMNIILWPDSDEPGEKYAARAANCLRNSAASLKVIRPFGPPNGAKGRDVCDWNGNAEDLAELTEIAEPYVFGLFFNGQAPDGTPIIRSRRGRDVTTEPISWIWKHWIALGKFQIIAGVPEAGKTTIALSYAAIISSGGTWPDGSRAAVGNVLIWSSEDNPADTLLPRLIRMGADLDNIYFIEQTIPPEDRPRPFNPATDLPALVVKAKNIGNVVLLILDPVVAVMPMIRSSHNNAETRNGMQPVVDFATESGAAVVGITHLTKGTIGKDPLERLNGSTAFGALPRIVMGASKNEAIGNDEPERIMVRIKSNIGPSGGGFGYHIDVAPLLERPDIEATRIVWEDALEGTARQLLADAENIDEDDKTSKVAEAMVFLKITLEKGERLQREVMAEANASGITERTLRRAAKGTVGKRKGALGWYWWALP